MTNDVKPDALQVDDAEEIVLCGSTDLLNTPFTVYVIIEKCKRPATTNSPLTCTQSGKMFCPFFHYRVS